MHWDGACYFSGMKGPGEESGVLELSDLIFEGASGTVGPLNLKIREGEERVLLLEHPGDETILIQIIKGMTCPRRGRVLKRGEDTTGWITLDGCVALVEPERFFSATVGEEIAFSARVGASKRRLFMPGVLRDVFEITGLKERLTESIATLSDGDRRLLALAGALLMLPDLLILPSSRGGVETGEEERIHRLVALGRRRWRMALLRFVAAGTIPPVPEGPHGY